MRVLLLLVLVVLALAGEAQPTIHVSSERAWYRPGETVCLRALLLDALTRAPVATTLPVLFRVSDGRGQVVWAGLATVEDGVAAAAWTTGPEGGAYTVTAAVANHAAAEPRRILVARSAEGLGTRLEAELAFDRRGYVPGDTAEVRLVLRDRAGVPAAGTPATLRVVLAGGAVREERVVSDAEGRASIRVPIPADLARPEGTVTASIAEAGGQQVASRSIPLASAELDLQATIEGGALVAGLPAVVILQARSHDGQPVDCRGSLRDGGQRGLGAFATLHEGRCRIAFTPTAGTAYRLQIEHPLTQAVALPAVQTAGAILAGEAVQPATGPLRLRASATFSGACRLLVLRRGIPVLEHALALAPGRETAIALELPERQAGVMDAVLRDPEGRIVAQRTLFRRPARQLTLTVGAPAVAGIADETAVELRLSDASGAPVRGLCSLSAVEAGDEDLIEARERPPRLPALAWLDGEVEELADSGSYLGEDVAATARLDLLLGVQAWRRAEGATTSERLRRLRGPEAPILRGLLAPALKLTPAALDLVATSEMGGSGTFMAVGAGGGAAGMFGSRQGGGRKRSVARFGGSRASEGCVAASLRFLKRHQSPNGLWQAEHWPKQSTLEAKADGLGTWTGQSADLCHTALATLAYLGAGYDHKTPNQYKLTVRRAVECLLSNQFPDGQFDPDPVVQASVVMALAEAYAMTSDPDLRGPTQLALTVLGQRQHRSGGWAASGDPDDARLDAVTTAWSVMACKSGYAAGLDVGETMQRAKGYLEVAWKAANPGWERFAPPFLAGGVFPGTYDTTTGTAHAPERSAAGACLAVFLGRRAGDPLLESLVSRIVAAQPQAPPLDPLQIYWGTLATFQTGGLAWATWNGTTRDLLIGLQRSDGPCAGSWDPAIYGPTGARWGRLLASAITVLNLEVYYRYAQLYQGRDKTMPVRADLRRLAETGDVDQARPPGTLAWWAAEPCGADGRVVLHLPAAGRNRRLTLRADALDAQGGFAASEIALEVRKPVEVTAQVPDHLLVGDRLSLPLGLRGAAAAQVDVIGPACHARVQAGRLEIEAIAAGSAQVRVSAASTAGTDALTCAITVTEVGAPWQDGGQRRGPARLHLPAAERFLPGSLRGSLVIESSVEDLLDAVHGRFAREPHGCFEQTSSTSYPLLVSCERRRARAIASDGVAEAFLAKAVARLQGFACPAGGFSLFGRDPGDPILTAYGLRQLRRLGGIVRIDGSLFVRQKAWLLGQRRTDGGFRSGTLATPPALGDLQIAAELGQDCPPADRERAYAAARAEGSAYAIGLAARLAREAGDQEQATALAALLRLDPEGGATPAGASPWRPEARIEATALAVLACLASGREAEALRGLDWLGRQRCGAAWDITQANVLAIEAFATAERLEKREAPAVLRLRRGDRELGTLAIPARQTGVITLPLELLPAGGDLDITVDGPAPPWRWQLAGRLLRPADAADAPLALSLRAPAQVAVGAPCEVLVGVRATADVYAPMVRVGLPAGLEPRAEALDRLVRAGRLGCWEWVQGEVRLYGERLTAGAAWDIPIACVAVAPGRSQGTPSSAYPYYLPGRVAWQPGLAISVAP